MVESSFAEAIRGFFDKILKKAPRIRAFSDLGLLLLVCFACVVSAIDVTFL